MADFDTAMHNAGLHFRLHTDRPNERSLVKHESKPTNLGVTPEVALAAALLDVSPAQLYRALKENGND